MEKNKQLVELKQVRKYFKDTKAVDDISLCIQQGEFVALLGPNGAGKTTLVEMIEGIQKPDSGEVIIDGKKWKGNESELHKMIGLSLQETHFFEKITVLETLQLFASFYNLDSKRVNEVLTLIRLEAKQNSNVKKLSGGQRQRLALGIALLNKPKLLLLDEPTTGLDPNARREIWEVLLQLKETENASLLLTTHYMEEASYLCDRIIVMDAGKVLAKGTLDELLAEHELKEVIEFRIKNHDFNSEKIKTIFPFANWDTKLNKAKYVVESIVDALPIFTQTIKDHQLELEMFECRKMTLDDLFVTMTGRNLSE